MDVLNFKSTEDASRSLSSRATTVSLLYVLPEKAVHTQAYVYKQVKPTWQRLPQHQQLHKYQLH
jgi:hypothetical protein